MPVTLTAMPMPYEYFVTIAAKGAPLEVAKVPSTGGWLGITDKDEFTHRPRGSAYLIPIGTKYSRACGNGTPKLIRS